MRRLTSEEIQRLHVIKDSGKYYIDGQLKCHEETLWHVLFTGLQMCDCVKFKSRHFVKRNRVDKLNHFLSSIPLSQHDVIHACIYAEPRGFITRVCDTRRGTVWVLSDAVIMKESHGLKYENLLNHSGQG